MKYDILPDKHVPGSLSVLGAASAIKQELSAPLSMDQLWERFQEREDAPFTQRGVSYELFILALDFLFATNLIDMDLKLIDKQPSVEVDEAS